MKIVETARSVAELARRIVTLYIDNVKLTVAEKLTLLVSAGVVLLTTLVLGVFAVAFFSGAAIEALEMVLEPWASYLIMGGVFTLLMVLVLLLRKPLIIHPIARFITKLVYENTHHNTPQE